MYTGKLKTLIGLNGDLDDLRPIRGAGRNVFQVMSDFGVQMDDGTQIWVSPKTFTDGGSIPTCIQWLISPWDDGCAEAFVVHDENYKTGQVSRERADKYLLEMLTVQEISAWKRNAIYYAVKWFGGGPWDECRKRAILGGFKGGFIPAYVPKAPKFKKRLK